MGAYCVIGMSPKQNSEEEIIDCVELPHAPQLRLRFETVVDPQAKPNIWKKHLRSPKRLRKHIAGKTSSEIWKKVPAAAEKAV